MAQRGLEGELRGEGVAHAGSPVLGSCPSTAQHTSTSGWLPMGIAHTKVQRDRGSKSLNSPALPRSLPAHPSSCSANPIHTVLSCCPHS